MAPSLRGRLVCFYCGSKSDRTRTANIRSWQCKKCEAVNHLDENGEITDPPTPSESLTKTRYAQSIQRPTNPVFDVPDDTLFCKTCIKNQHLYSQSLASYFPSPDAPDYAEYEEAYPAFQRGLEERYPQVCEDCEPRVRARINKTTYAAKTDHLRRMMERTREGRIVYRKSSWKSYIYFLGGVAWLASWAGQAIWNGIGLWISKKGYEYDGIREVDMTLSGSSCLQQVIQGSGLAPGCVELADLMAYVALILGVISLLWNPRLQDSLASRGGQVVGKRDYYFLQILLLGGRCASYMYLSRTTNNSELVVQVIHASSLFLGLLFNIISFRSIRTSYNTRVLFQESPEPLVARRAQQISSISESTQPNADFYSSLAKPSTRPFSINDFAPRVVQQPLPYQPPTPPPDENDDEAMDWTPSQETNFRPTTIYRSFDSAVQQTEQIQESPFHGRLPPNIVSQNHRLRNPPNQPSFRKASTKQKQAFFNTPNKRGGRDEDSDTVSVAETTVTDFSPMKFTSPKFFPQSDHHAETGLEDILARSFTIAEEPAEIRENHKRGRTVEDQRRLAANGSVNWSRMLICCIMLGFCVLWAHTGYKSFDHQSWLRTAQGWISKKRDPEMDVVIPLRDE